MKREEMIEAILLARESLSRKARQSFPAFAALRQPIDQQPALHHALICEALDALERGDIPGNRLMIFMPPGSAKSTYGSKLFPQYFLGRNPQLSVILASHTAELAEGWGRKIRNGMQEPEFGEIFPTVGVASDNASAGRWATNQAGEFFAAGVGGSVTGRRADLGVIDDPVASREDADSERVRQKTWDWYTNDFLTRLKPGAKQVCIMCMAGDTRVLMAGGDEKLLRDIRPGDSVATYRDGAVSTSLVRNWASQGIDQVYEIRMKSGRIARANERHPFLVVRDGDTQWLKLRDLKIGDQILSVSGVSTEASFAQKMDAESQPSAKGFAHLTTTKRYGPAATDRHQSTQSRAERRGCDTDTESTQRNMTAGLPSKADAALSASSLQAVTCGLTGVASSVLTTTTAPEGSEGCSATTATLPLDMAKLKTCYSEPLSTCEITPDCIVEIVDAGREEVFDVQIDETENFIANGLVSHNTRWHEDDLAGRLLEREKAKWKVLKLPMVAGNNDPLGREEGERLWPEWFTDEMLETAQADARSWISLYQQEPRPAEGAEFKRTWINRYAQPPKLLNKILLVDPAGDPSKAQGKRKKSDFTAMWVVGLGSDENAYIVDGIRDRLNLTQRADAVFALHKKHKPMQTRYEQYGLQADVEHIKSEMERRQYRFSIKEVGGNVEKNARIRRLVPWFEGGRMWLPMSMKRINVQGVEYDVIEDFIEHEYATFPVGRNDDSFDCLARLAEPGLSLPYPEDDPMDDPRMAVWSALDELTGY